MSPAQVDGPSFGLGTLLLAAVVTGLLSEAFRRLAWRWQIVDEPGSRRLHERTTPRGGGIAVAAVWIALVLWNQGLPAQGAATAQIVGAGGLALLGFWDDVRPLPAWLRLIGQCALLALVAALWLGGSVLGSPLLLALVLVGALFTVNAFNFVDGADGLVPLQALAIGLGLHLCVSLDAGGWQQAAAVWDGRLLLFVACLFGFLPANWPRARLFLGDVGSLFVGAVCVGAALQAVAEGALRPAAAAALFAVVWVDPVWTLLQRLSRRAPILESHMEHGYHHLLKRRVSHLRLSSGAAAYTSLWAVPIAAAL